jgi:hypothetical protein
VPRRTHACIDVESFRHVRSKADVEQAWSTFDLRQSPWPLPYDLETNLLLQQLKASSQSIDIYHVEHCFSYLRQGIQCGGDLTLEGPDIVDGPNQGTLHGWNVSHSFVDWSSLRHWMLDHSV